MNLSCKVYQDLIPLYVENLLSRDSKELLEAHLNNCPDCQTYLIHTSETLTCASLSLDTDSKAAMLKKLHRQINLTQWAFLSCGIFLLILFTLSDTLLQNIIFLPLIGFIGYFFTRKTFSLPLILSILLTVTFIFKDVMTACFDGILGYFFYLVIFFFLTLAGTMGGYVIKHISIGFKTQTRLRKLGTIATWLLITCLAGTALFFTNSMNGNPITACYAQFKMKNYLEETYPDMTANLSSADYNYKGSYYDSSARFYTEETTHTFNVYYRSGKVWDDYFTSYLEDLPNEYHLSEEISEEIGTLLTDYDIPFLSVSCQLRIEKGLYDNVPYNKETFKEPLSLNIYTLTDIKQTPYEFASWCEQIRLLLVSNGYNISDILFESDPYFMANRLSLNLDKDELNTPLKNITSYKGFFDYGKANHIDATMTAQEIGYTKVDFYYDSMLSKELTNTIRSLGLESAYVKASVNSEKELDLSICYFGKRISTDTFAEEFMLIINTLNKEKIFDTYTIMPLSIQYGWGTSREVYSYSVYDEHLDTVSSDTIVQTLLSEKEIN